MKKAVIIYNSKTGTTKKYAEEIDLFLKAKNLETDIYPIKEYLDESVKNADYLFLGCWTNGLMILLQHPDRNWKDFALKLPDGIKSKTALFTTYKMLTGSMFNNMRKYLTGKVSLHATTLKSRNGLLSDKDKALLNDFIS
jgi:flavodoxin